MLRALKSVALLTIRDGAGWTAFHRGRFTSRASESFVKFELWRSGGSSDARA